VDDRILLDRGAVNAGLNSYDAESVDDVCQRWLAMYSDYSMAPSPSLDDTSDDTCGNAVSSIVGVSKLLLASKGSRENSESGDDPRR